ncbi:hypothetical protein D9613_006489 [Agrocybe pediades]|uniref:Hexosyltransferase n=1 Tax=Agrocybe pediades TaxID=84607 RepID=A0A8H4QGS4_9AGAR|nr:hypothetical protein D9613_006489 [Agrocybe pediades]
MFKFLSGPRRYEPLPVDLERSSSVSPNHQSRRLPAIPPRLRNLIIAFGLLFLGWLLFHRSTEVPPPAVKWGPDDFNFTAQRPRYLDVSVDRPVVIRLTIMTRVDEFERRHALRQAMLDGVSKKHVHIAYKFVVGRPVMGDNSSTNHTMLQAIGKENELYDDVLVVEEIKDVPKRLSEKRYAALKWSASVPEHQYDWAMTMDSDTFCRFRLLAQRLRYIYPAVNPREQPALVGRMGGHLVYYENTVPDDTEDDDAEDHIIKGNWYSFPAGIGYMLSSNLTATILSAKPALPHHVNYPSDDVMIGAWVAGLKNFHDPSIKFETTKEHDDPPIRQVHPKPYLPYSVDTTIIDDKIGWHDFKDHGGFEKPTGWESACVHRMTSEQMRAFRKLDEVKHEWERLPDY